MKYKWALNTTCRLRSSQVYVYVAMALHMATLIERERSFQLSLTL